MIRFAVFAAAIVLQVASAVACPFCTTPRPSLSQQIGRADAALLGDVTDVAGERVSLRVRQVLKGGSQYKAESLVDVATSTDAAGNRPRRGSLLLVMSADTLWTTVPLDEVSFVYVARLPQAASAVTDRLRYAIRFLEHADPLISDDAYLEFGHAPLDEVAKLADELPVDRLRNWIGDEAIPPERKGLYGLLLGLAATAQNRDDITADFWRWITMPASDFRSGFDGVLGGYLWLANEKAIERLERHFLEDPRAPIGDLRHLLTAMRVYHDNDRNVPKDELLRVYRRFLDRPALAALAIADLSRWHDWQSLERIAALFGQPGYDDRPTIRAVIAYLLACPLPEARRHVARLRKLVPELVTEAERLEDVQSSER